MDKTEKKNVPGEVEDFAREQSPEELAEAEARVNALIEQHERKQTETAGKIAQLELAMKEKTIDFQQALATMAELQDEVAKRDLDTIVGVDEFYERQNILESIGVKEEDLNKLQQEYDRMMELLAQMEQSMQDKTLLEQADAHMDEFYADQAEKLEAHREDQKMRDASRICEDYNCVFVHTIKTAPQKRGANNTPLREGTDWESKLNINIGLQSDLSTSTIRENTPSDGLWHGNIATIHTRGHVKFAQMGDAGTVVAGINRVSNKFEHSIDDAVTHDRRLDENQDGSYNELVLAKPELAGFLVGGSGIDSDMEASRRIFEISNEKGIPVYIRDKETGAFHECNGFKTIPYGSSTREIYDVGKEVPVQDIINNGYEMPEEERAEAREKVFEDTPFKLFLQEKRDVNQAMFARTAYSKFDNISKDGEGYIQDDTIAESNESRALVRTYAGTNELTPVRVKDRDTYLDALKESNDLLNNGTLEDIAKLEEKSQSKSITDEDRNKLKEQIEYKRGRIKKRNSERGFLFHGFATVAEGQGDTEIAKKARDLANDLISFDVYKEAMERRVGPSGGFRITEEDLKHVYTHGD